MPQVLELQDRSEPLLQSGPVTLNAKKPIVFAGMTEAQVVEKAQAGDVSCFEALYARHKRRVFSLCLRMTGDYGQAEDFMQEIFLQLYRKIALFRGESAFSTWLHRLSVNVVLMHFRKKSLKEISLEESMDPQDAGEPPKEFGASDSRLQGSLDRLALDRAIQDLPPGYRIIFILHDVEGYEHNEIAEMLGCSIGNSKSQLHKARLKLRTLLHASDEQKTKTVSFDNPKMVAALDEIAA